MITIIPHNIIHDQTDFVVGVPVDNIQTTPITPHPAEQALAWSQPSIEVEPISTYHAMATFSERDKLVAYMELAGDKRKNIAKALNVSYAVIMNIQRKPEYRLFIAEEGKVIRENTHQSIQDRIMGDAHRNLDVLMQIRDGVGDQSGVPGWSDRRQAVTELMARQYPKVLKTQTEEQHTYNFESKTFENMMKTLTGVMEIPVEGQSPEQIIEVLQAQLPQGDNKNG